MNLAVIQSRRRWRTCHSSSSLWRRPYWWLREESKQLRLFSWELLISFECDQAIKNCYCWTECNFDFAEISVLKSGAIDRLKPSGLSVKNSRRYTLFNIWMSIFRTTISVYPKWKVRLKKYPAWWRTDGWVASSEKNPAHQILRRSTPQTPLSGRASRTN